MTASIYFVRFTVINIYSVNNTPARDGHAQVGDMSTISGMRRMAIYPKLLIKRPESYYGVKTLTWIKVCLYRLYKSKFNF